MDHVGRAHWRRDIHPAILDRFGARNAELVDAATVGPFGAECVIDGGGVEIDRRWRRGWLDRIVIAGKTFGYTEAGARGLAGGKKVIIASSRGGLYAPGAPQAANDFQETYLRTILGFIGIEDIEIVRAEGLALGPEQREAAIHAALASVAPAVARFLPAKAA
jgi:Flavodoxin-like fold